MAQIAPPHFGYSARALFGKDHHRQLPAAFPKDLSDDAKKMLKYIVQLEHASGRQFDNILGRLHHMLRSAGADLDQDSEECMDKVFSSLKKFAADEDKCSRTARWKIQELQELRASHWKDIDQIIEFYENPANFEVPELNNNKPLVPEECPRLPYHESLAPYSPPHSAQSPPSSMSPKAASHSSITVSPGSLRSRTLSGSSTTGSRVDSGISVRSRIASGESVRSRNTSGGSVRSRNTSGGTTDTGREVYRSRGSLSRQGSSVIEEDVFHDAPESFRDDSSVSSADSDAVSSRSSRSGGSSNRGAHATSAISPAKLRLMQISAGKSIKYTRNFLLGCWPSAFCEVMPSNLMHTIANSDIAYIITGPPFRDPVTVISTRGEPATTLIAPPPPALHSMSVPPVPPPPPMLMRSLSAPAPTMGMPMMGMPVPPLRTMSTPGPYGMPPPHVVPILQKEAFKALFKMSLQQMTPNNQ